MKWIIIKELNSEGLSESEFKVSDIFGKVIYNLCLDYIEGKK